MIREWKKLISVLTLMLAIVSMVMFNNKVLANASILSRFEVYRDNYTFLTGENVTFNVGFSMSDESALVADAVL